ncbi:hypothetical protein Q8A67_019172 [Cirrhinus molitorella]|uniref:Uncharacterized protein n=1 Tax=Cirrhinus molitorella TaxID=172907 RepID=A0AA88TG54_9TELE|nr:hypothetical protein Q8A67_019172 [Cirrhinus molitorella]
MRFPLRHYYPQTPGPPPGPSPASVAPVLWILPGKMDQQAGKWKEGAGTQKNDNSNVRNLHKKVIHMALNQLAESLFSAGLL